MTDHAKSKDSVQKAVLGRPGEETANEAAKAKERK